MEEHGVFDVKGKAIDLTSFAREDADMNSHEAQEWMDNTHRNKRQRLDDENGNVMMNESADDAIDVSNYTTPQFSGTSTPSYIDLTNAESEDDCLINEEETNRDVCFGQINTQVLVMFPQPFTEDMEVQLVRYSSIDSNVNLRVFKANTDVCIGVLVQDMANALGPLLEEKLIWTEAIIPSVIELRPFAVPLHLKLYGRQEVTSRVNLLKLKNVYLQTPISFNPNTRYSNPHQNVVETLVHGNQTTYGGVRNYYSVTISQEEVKTQIDAMFKSLKSSSDLPEVEADPRLTTPLYKHQKQGLFFAREREREQAYSPKDNDEAGEHLTPLWKKRQHLDLYLNVITNQEVRRRPKQVKGGILADDMGLGKSITMIGNLLSTMAEAERFSQQPPTLINRPVVEEAPKQKATFSMQQPKKKSQDKYVHATPEIRSRATLIVCPLSTVQTWEEQFAAHVQPGAIDLYIYHGGSRTSDINALASHDVVLTTYNVLGTEFGKQARSLMSDEQPGPTRPSPLQLIEWFRVVLDEAHIIKEPGTVQSRAACDLTADRRWALTGTPIQNKLDDLYALIKFLHLEPFSHRQAWSQYFAAPMRAADPIGVTRLQVLMKHITLRRTKTQTDSDGKPMLTLPARLDHIRYVELDPQEQSVYDALRSRTQRSVQELIQQNTVMKQYAHVLQSILRLRQVCVDKTLIGDNGVEEDLATDIERNGITTMKAQELYAMFRDSGQAYCSRCMRAFPSFLSFPKDSTSPDIPVFTRCRHLLCLECVNLTMARDFPSVQEGQTCHCILCDFECNSVKDLVAVYTEREDTMGDDMRNADIQIDSTSTKTKALLNDLQDFQAGGHKTVVFSQWTGFLDRIQFALERAQIPLRRLDGTMNRLERSNALTEFKERSDVFVLLVSIKAGGVGLNLTVATRAIIMEPYWNPAVESQAIDRVHRLGQTQQVETIRYIVKNSIEEKVMALQRHKTELAEMALHTRQSKQDMLKKRLEDLKFLFGDRGGGLTT